MHKSVLHLDIIILRLHFGQFIAILEPTRLIVPLSQSQLVERKV